MSLVIDTSFESPKSLDSAFITPSPHQVPVPNAPSRKTRSTNQQWESDDDKISYINPTCLFNNKMTGNYLSALQTGLPTTTTNPNHNTQIHIQTDYTESGQRILTTREFPNCLYVSNLTEGITEVELTDLFHNTFVCRVSMVHLTRSTTTGYLIAFVYLVFWELDKLTDNMYNRLAEYKPIYINYQPVGLPASVSTNRLPQIRIQLARNKSQLNQMKSKH